MVSKKSFKFFIFLVGMFLLVAPATAQGDPVIEQLEVVLLPEHDRPAVLVIYRVRLAEDSLFPATVSLPIPASAGDPYVVAKWLPDGSRDDQVEWTRRVDGEWAMIEVQTDTSGIWLEYYDELNFTGEGRDYTFTWYGGLDLGGARIEVIPPLAAKEMQIVPPGKAILREDGLTSYEVDLGPQDSAISFDIELTYRKSPAIETIEVLEPDGHPSIEQVAVSLWPEYDRSAVLVICRVRLTDDTPLPATVTLPIPASVGDPHVVAKWLPDGSPDDRVEWTRQVDGDWAMIEVQTDANGVWVEYYDELFFDGQERSYTYLWPGGFNPVSFIYEVQQPLAVNAMHVRPPGSVFVSEEGFLIHQNELQSQATKSAVSISFVYNNPTSQLSEGLVPSGPALVRPETTQGGTPDLNRWLPWLLGGFGAALLALGLFLYSRLDKAWKPAPPRKRRRRPSKKAKGADREIDASPVFCHDCGMQASVSDHFCRRCGTQLRR